VTITESVGKLVQDVVRLQRKLARLTSRVNNDLSDKIAILQRIQADLEAIKSSQEDSTEITNAQPAFKWPRKEDKPTPLQVGEQCILARTNGWSDGDIASAADVTIRRV
jgi:hypothetical protein